MTKKDIAVEEIRAVRHQISERLRLATLAEQQHIRCDHYREGQDRSQGLETRTGHVRCRFKDELGRYSQGTRQGMRQVPDGSANGQSRRTYCRSGDGTRSLPTICTPRRLSSVTVFEADVTFFVTIHARRNESAVIVSRSSRSWRRKFLNTRTRRRQPNGR